MTTFDSIYGSCFYYHDDILFSVLVNMYVDCRIESSSGSVCAYAHTLPDEFSIRQYAHTLPDEFSIRQSTYISYCMPPSQVY